MVPVDAIMFIGIVIIVGYHPTSQSPKVAISPYTVLESGVAPCDGALLAYNTNEGAAVVDEDVPVSKLPTEGHRQLGFSTIIERQDVTNKRSKPFNNLKYHLHFVYFKLIVAVNSDI